MRYIKQRHKHGDGVACLAMICNHSYERVRKWFKDNHNYDPVKQLFSRLWILRYLAAHDYWTQLVWTNDSRTVRGFAFGYILYVQDKETHQMKYIAADEDSNLFDPSDKNRTILSGRHVVEIIGCMNHYHIGREARIG